MLKNDMKRVRYLDIVKGLSIICIVLLHYERDVFPTSINVFIGSFMITAFYVVTGWIDAMRSVQTTFVDFIRRKWRHLCIPYFWWSSIILLLDLILLALGFYDGMHIKTDIYKTITLRGIGTLWFLPALLGGEIIWFYLKKHNIILIVLAFIIAICYQYFYHRIFDGNTDLMYRIIDAPFRTISNMLEAWVGIAFGFFAYLLCKKKLLNRSNLVKGMIGASLFIFAFVLANYLPRCISIFWHYLAPLIGPLGLLLLFNSIQDLRILNYFSFWGQNSLNLMVTHYSIVLVILTLIVEDFFHMPYSGWVSILCFVVSMPIQYLLVILIDKFARFTLGK